MKGIMDIFNFGSRSGKNYQTMWYCINKQIDTTLEYHEEHLESIANYFGKDSKEYYIELGCIQGLREIKNLNKNLR